MTNGIQGSLEEIGVLSTQIDTEADEFGRLLEETKKVNTELKQYWQGPDAEKYATTVEQQSLEMDNLYKAIKTCAKWLSDIKTAYEKVQEANMGQ